MLFGSLNKPSFIAFEKSYNNCGRIAIILRSASSIAFVSSFAEEFLFAPWDIAKDSASTGRNLHPSVFSYV